MYNCLNHNDKKAKNICNICNQWFCDECLVDIDGKTYCKSCLKNNINKNFNQNINLINNLTKSNNSFFMKFILFIASLIPGIGQMSYGYIKRGLIIFIIFIATLMLEIFYPIVFILIAFSFFDTLKIKHNIQNSIYIEDGIKDILIFFKENKLILSISLILIIGIVIFLRLKYIFFVSDLDDLFIYSILNFFKYGIYDDDILEFLVGLLFFIILPMILIAIISFIIIKKVKQKNKANIIINNTKKNNFDSQNNNMQNNFDIQDNNIQNDFYIQDNNQDNSIQNNQ